MNCEEQIVDVRKTPKEETEKRKIVDALVWKLNNTQPRTEEYFKIHAIVGAAAVVTKDVPDYAVVVGNPTHVVKTLDPAKFTE